MEQIIVKGKIEFCEKENKEYNREFTAMLQDSAAFEYGNKTSVVIVNGKMANGMTLAYPEIIDTRYDRTIKRNEADFRLWLKTYFKQHYSEHVLTLY